MTFSPLLCHWCSRVEVGARRSVPHHLDQLGRRRSWQRAPAFSFEAVGFYLVHALIVDFRFRSVGSLWVDIRSGIGFDARHRRRSVRGRQRRRFPTQPSLAHRAEGPRKMLLSRNGIRILGRAADLGGGDWWVDSRRQGFAYSSVLLRPAREPKTSCTASSSSNAIRGAVQESTASCSAPKTRGPVAARRYPTDCAIPESAAA